MILASYTLKFDEKAKEEIIQILRYVNARTQYYAGCINSDLWVCSEHNHIMLNETWESWEHLKNYFANTISKQLMIALELSIEKPEVYFAECSNIIKGVDWIEKLMNNIEI
ncbi:MAG: hypothetical protein WBJ84_09790 [Bacteroidales bacterium]